MKRQFTYSARKLGRFSEKPKPCTCRWTGVLDGWLLTKVSPECPVHKDKAGIWRDISTVTADKSVL